MTGTADGVDPKSVPVYSEDEEWVEDDSGLINRWFRTEFKRRIYLPRINNNWNERYLPYDQAIYLVEASKILSAMLRSLSAIGIDTVTLKGALAGWDLFVPDINECFGTLEEVGLDGWKLSGDNIGNKVYQLFKKTYRKLYTLEKLGFKLKMIDSQNDSNMQIDENTPTIESVDACVRFMTDECLKMPPSSDILGAYYKVKDQSKFLKNIQFSVDLQKWKFKLLRDRVETIKDIGKLSQLPRDTLDMILSAKEQLLLY